MTFGSSRTGPCGPSMRPSSGEMVTAPSRKVGRIPRAFCALIILPVLKRNFPSDFLQDKDGHAALKWIVAAGRLPRRLGSRAGNPYADLTEQLQRSSAHEPSHSLRYARRDGGRAACRERGAGQG